MGIEDFLKQWEVVEPPQPLGEEAGHRVRIERTGSGNGVTITCPVHGLRRGTYSPEGNRIDGFEDDGSPFSIVLRPRIVYQSGDLPNTGSWTAEDTSGQLQ